MEKSLNEETYEKLKYDIMNFRLLPGDSISAQKVALRYDVSRTPAREAIVNLEKEGLLKIIPQSGTYVACINCRRSAQEWFVRKSLEMGMVDAVFENADSELLDKMAILNERLIHYTEENEKIPRIEIDNAFHELIYECSGELLAQNIIQTQMSHYNRIRYLAELNSSISAKTNDEHEMLIEAIKNEPKVCHYLDMPIQHASDNILKRMGRRTSKQELTDILAKLRREIPDIALRTTLITGFPGETDVDHEEVMQFIDECEFDRLGVFTYSREEDTVAAQMPDQIDEEIKEKYRDELMQLQQEISADRSAAMIGRIVRVMIEGFIPEDNTYVGRSYKDAPNVDGLVFVECDRELMSGDFIDVKITGSTEYDLIGTIVE